METKTNKGYLLLADISGYTSFMAGTELEHSQHIIAEFLRGIIGNLTPTLTLSEVEGDAVFVYCTCEHIQRGETLLELIETTYGAFKNQQESIQRKSTCTCDACRSISILDLKFIVHAGEFGFQNITGTKKPIGSSVNLAHRLLKNHIAEETSWRAYTLISDDAAQMLAVEDGSMHRSREAYEHFGEIRTTSYDLSERYRAMMRQKSVKVSDADAFFRMERRFPVPAPLLWEWLNDPSKRNLYSDSVEWKAGKRTRGRTGAGSENHCSHGKGESVEEIVDWKPFDYYTCRSASGPFRFLYTDEITTIDGGTQYVTRWTVENKFPRWIFFPILRMMMLKVFKFEEILDRLEKQLEGISRG